MRKLEIRTQQSSFRKGHSNSRPVKRMIKKYTPCGEEIYPMLRSAHLECRKRVYEIIIVEYKSMLSLSVPESAYRISKNLLWNHLK